MRKLAYAVLSPKLEILPIILCKIDDSRNFAARFKSVFFTAFFAVAGEIPESHIKKNTLKIINVAKLFELDFYKISVIFVSRTDKPVSTAATHFDGAFSFLVEFPSISSILHSGWQS